MKKTISVIGFMAFVVMAFVVSSYTKTERLSSKKSCTVTVKYGCGDPADNVTVTPLMKSDILGWRSADCPEFKTNSSGVVNITWEYTRIDGLYIKGNRYEMRLEDGKSYNVTLKQKYS